MLPMPKESTVKIVLNQLPSHGLLVDQWPDRQSFILVHFFFAFHLLSIRIMNFSFFRIPIRVRLSFCLLLLFFTDYYKNPNIENLITTLVLVLGIYIHELGHAFTARYFKASPSIVFYYLGGMTIYDQSLSIKRRIIVILNGPLVQSFLVVIPYLILKTYNIRNWHAHFTLSSSIRINSVVVLLNLLPIFPLDGGQLLKYFMELFCKDKGLKIACAISKFFLLAFAAILFYYKVFFFPALLLILFWKDQKQTISSHVAQPSNNSIIEETQIKVNYLPTKKIYYFSALLVLITYCLVPITNHRKEVRFQKSFTLHFEKCMEKYGHVIGEMIQIKNNVNSDVDSIIYRLTDQLKDNVRNFENKKFLKTQLNKILEQETAIIEKKQELQEMTQRAKDLEGKIWQFESDEFKNTAQILEKYKKNQTFELLLQRLEQLRSLVNTGVFIQVEQLTTQLKALINFLLQNRYSISTQGGKLTFSQQKTQKEFANIIEKLEHLHVQLHNSDADLNKKIDCSLNDLGKVN